MNNKKNNNDTTSFYSLQYNMYTSEIRSNHVAAGARHCFGLGNFRIVAVGVVEGGIPQHFGRREIPPLPPKLEIR